MEGLLLLLVVGFLMYYLIRHPLISLSVALQVLGLLILGTIGLSIIFVCIVLINLVSEVMDIHSKLMKYNSYTNAY